MPDQFVLLPLEPPTPIDDALADYLKYNPLAQRAAEFADVAHAGAFRKDGTTAYIEHPRSVAAWFLSYSRVKKLAPEDIEAGVCAALLHDVVEDTQVTMGQLKSAFANKRICELVALLTKPDTTRSAPASYYQAISRDPLAIALKYSDRIANLWDAVKLSPTPANRRFWQDYLDKTSELMAPLARGDDDLDRGLNRAMYVVRARLATSDPWCVVVASEGWGVVFYMVNNSASTLRNVRTRCDGWMTEGGELLQGHSEWKSYGDIDPGKALAIGMDEAGGYMHDDVAFERDGSTVQQGFSIQPDDWCMPELRVGEVTGVVARVW